MCSQIVGTLHTKKSYSGTTYHCTGVLLILVKWHGLWDPSSVYRCLHLVSLYLCYTSWNTDHWVTEYLSKQGRRDPHQKDDVPCVNSSWPSGCQKGCDVIRLITFISTLPLTQTVLFGRGVTFSVHTNHDRCLYSVGPSIHLRTLFSPLRIFIVKVTSHLDVRRPHSTNRRRRLLRKSISSFTLLSTSMDRKSSLHIVHR